MAPPASSRPKDKGKERRKTKNQKFEAVFNRRVLWVLQPAAGQKRRKGKGQITTGICRGLCVHGGFGASSRQPAKGEGKRERGKPKIRNSRRYRIGGGFGTSSRQPAKRQRKERERKAKNQKFEAV